MGQEVFVRPNAGKKSGLGVLSTNDYPLSADASSVVLIEQRFDNGLVSLPAEIIQPNQKAVFSEALIWGFDLIGAIVLSLLASPLMLLAALLVKLLSPGPVLFKQKRVGKRGKIFTLYKFRTMVDGAEKETGPVWAARDDGRITQIGKILRCTRLDELPQLFNVFKGDMSLVGPRPERPFFVNQHRALRGVRLMVKPGITGLAQVRAYYDLRPEHKLKYDFLYIQNRSFILNVYIMFMTIPVILLRKGW